MKLRFIVDTQLPPSLAEFFRRRGLDATHVADYPNGALTSDREIIAIGREEMRIIVTKDNDFMDYYLLKGYPPSVVLLQLGNIKNSELFIFLDKHIERIINLFEEKTERLVVVHKNRLIFF
jgi:predicted nuclease of predicted toxin-antitoxin system